jgi:hypothetical protein
VFLPLIDNRTNLKDITSLQNRFSLSMVTETHLNVSFFFDTVIAAALTLVMGQRYLLTGKIMPAGLVAGIR